MPEGRMTRIGQRFVSKSGREWEVIRVDRSVATLLPLGPDTYGAGGGVKVRRVELARLDQQTHGWRWKSRARA